jgi:uncharacterized RmlC-like cupin family protein
LETCPNNSDIHPITDCCVRDSRGERATRGLSEPTTQSTIIIVHPGELSSETRQTPGSLRLSAIPAMHGITSSLWAGIFLVEPSAKTGIHHHGKQDTVVYVLEGEANIRWGNLGEHSATVRAGDFLHVPSWLPHQKLNPSKEHPFRWVVVRSTPEPIVVNLPRRFLDARLLRSEGLLMYTKRAHKRHSRRIYSCRGLGRDQDSEPDRSNVHVPG